jgi:photosystem II stability/assembly factor-like uncharacterized protein
VARKQKDLSMYRDALARGPESQRAETKLTDESTTHKRRCEWYRAREAWPYREVSGHLLAAERDRVRSELPHPVDPVAWQFAGPSNIGGRMTSMVCDPDDAHRLIVGAAGGGVWRSLDAGLNWEALWHQEPSLNVGALAIDPADPDVVLCGTGEANLSADSHAGVGLYATADFGDTWQLLADSQTTGIPSRIGAIAIDPLDSQHIRIGGVSHGAGTDGMFTSTDGGQTWTRETFVTTGRYRCHEICFDPVNAGTIYATVTAGGFASGIWRTRDGGVTWQQLGNGLPHPTLIGRGSLALAPSDTDRLYALLADDRGGVLGVFRSTDGGDAWTAVSGSHFDAERQMSYNNTIVVHPTDPDHVLCGGVEIHRTTDGGASWDKVTIWHHDKGDPDYAHADQHKLVMPAVQPGWVYACNDGGVDFSADGGTTWENRSDDLAVTMYYDLEMAQTDGRMYGGGCQDNGTNITVSGGTDDHFMISGGDGGWITIDPTNALHLFASSQQMRLLRFRDPQGWADVSPLHPNSAERRAMWMVFIAIDENDPDTVFTGTRRVWRTLDDGDSWAAVSGFLDDSDITAIEVCLADSQRVYVGTENGGIFRSDDGGDTWTGNIAGPLLPGRTITRLKASPVDADLVYATVANLNNSHVFRSSDAGVNWEDIDGGQLPRVAHHAIAISTADPDQIFVASDVGVHASMDGGDTWVDFTANLPNVMVVDLVYHRADRTLTAATYGRSLWRLDLG